MTVIVYVIFIIYQIIHIDLISPEYLQNIMVILCVVIDCTDRQNSSKNSITKLSIHTSIMIYTI